MVPTNRAFVSFKRLEFGKLGREFLQNFVHGACLVQQTAGGIKWPNHISHRECCDTSLIRREHLAMILEQDIRFRYAYLDSRDLMFNKVNQESIRLLSTSVLDSLQK